MEPRLLLHGRDASTATPVEFDVEIVGAFESEDERDWFVLDGQAGRGYELRSDANVSVVNALGESLVEDLLTARGIRFFGGAINEKIYLITEPANSRQAEYILEVSSFQDDHGNTLASATELVLGEQKPLTVVEREFDIFKFAAKANTDYVLQLTTLTSGIPVSSGYYGLMTLDERISSRRISTPDGSLAHFHREEDQDVYIQVFSRGSADYLIEIVDAREVDQEANDLAGAQDVPIGSSLLGQIEFPTDTDWFKLSGATGDAFLIDASGVPAEGTVTMYGADGRRIGPIRGDAFVTAPFPADMAVYLEVASDSGDEILAYDLSVLSVKDGGDSPNAAETIEVNTEIADRADGNEVGEWFTFTAQPSIPYQVEASSAAFEFYHLDGTLIEGDVVNAGLDRSRSARLFFENETQVSVRVFPETTGATYRIGVQQIVDDHGDEIAFASDYALKLSILLHPGDEDWIKYSPSVGRTYLFRGFRADLSLWNVDGQQIQDEVGLNVVWTATSDAPVFVRLVNPYDSIPFVSAGLTVADVVASDDHSDQQHDATELSVPGPTSGRILIPSDRDWFTVSLDEGVHRIEGGRSVNFRVVDAAGNELARKTTDETTLDVELSEATVVFIEATADAYSQWYSLSVVSLVDDHGNSTVDATAISRDGILFSGELEHTDDVDYFSFQAAAGETLSATIDSFLTSTAIQVVDESNNLVEALSQGAASFTFTAPQTAQYFLLVSNADGATHSYRVSVVDVNDDHGNSSADATRMDGDFFDQSESSPGVSVNGNTDYAGDADWFVFRGVAGRSYKVTSSRGDALSVYDSNGTLLLSDAPFNGGLALAPTEDGDIFLEFVGERRDQYRINVEGYQDDHGNSVATATPIQGNTTVSGQFEVGYESDFFSFQADASVRYYFDITGSGVVKLLNAQGENLDEAPEFGGFATLVADQPQTIIARVDHLWSRPEEYELRFFIIQDDDHADGTTSATPIEVGRWAHGVNEYPFDVDVFSFLAEPGLSYHVQEFGNSTVTITDEAGNTRQSSWGPITIDVDEPQTVFLQFEGARVNSGYGFLVSSYFDDHSGSLTRGTSVALADKVVGAFEVEGDTDVFLFQAAAGREYVIEVKAAGGVLQGEIPVAVAYDASSEILSLFPASNSVIRSESDQTIAVELSQRFGPTRYALTVRDFSEIDDFGGTAEDAFPLELGQTVTGTLSGVGDDDWFVIETEPNHVYVFDFSAADSIRIVGADAIQYLDERTWSFGDARPMFVNVRDNNRVYVRLWKDTNVNYEFSVQKLVDDHPDEWAAGTSVGLGKSIEGEIDFLEDVDAFAYAAEAGQKFQVELSHGTLQRSRLTLRNSSFAELDTQWGEARNGKIQTRTITVAEAGTYYITVDNGWDELGTYSVQVIDTETEPSPSPDDPVRFVDALCRQIRTGTYSEDFDFESDGAVDDLDLLAYLDSRNTRKGDSNMDGIVDFVDFLHLSANFGLAEDAEWATGDFDCSGDVGFPDFLELSFNFGK